MKINIGPWVDGDEFYGRERELRNLEEILSNPKANVLVPGHRRIGKTSLLKEFIRRHNQTYRFIYFDLESRQSVIELCRDLIRQIEKDHPRYISKQGLLTNAWNVVAKMLPELKNAGLVEIKTGEISPEAKDLLNRMEDLFEELVKQNFVFIFDEFSDFIWKLKESGLKEVRQFLEWLRQLRQHGKIRLIVSGSINIVSTAEELNLSDLINDFSDLEIFPLDDKEIDELLTALLSGIGVTLTKDAMAYAIERLSDGVPFFIQLFASSLRAYRKTDVNIYDLESIQQIYRRMTEKQHKEYIDLHSRLEGHLPTDEHKGAVKILAHLAMGAMTFDDLWPYVETILNEKKKLQKVLKRLIDESYIMNRDGEYQFVSPMLGDWWRKSYEWER